MLCYIDAVAIGLQDNSEWNSDSGLSRRFADEVLISVNRPEQPSLDILVLPSRDDSSQLSSILVRRRKHRRRSAHNDQHKTQKEKVTDIAMRNGWGGGYGK